MMSGPARGNGKLLAYVVTRTVTAEETGCVPVVRQVDFIGEDAVLPRLGGALDAILNRAGGEYMDCYNAGIPAEVLAGRRFYLERLEGDGSVIPNYLTPPHCWKTPSITTLPTSRKTLYCSRLTATRTAPT